MKELLSDLFEFALKKKKEGEFYCLQPIIVQRVTDERKLKDIALVSNWNDVTSDNTWEVVDGQQRLTSVYIIYRYLIAVKATSEEEMELDENFLYKLCYETHPKTKDYLEKLSKDTLEWNDIDEKHIAEAFQAIDEWFKNEAKSIAIRMNRSDKPSRIADVIKNLLNTKKEEIAEETGSAQFIWYELEPGSNKNPIDEFLNINNGKIRLTDAELIKALFLQKRNFLDHATKGGKQTELAMGWESMENALHRDDFWQFLSAKEEESDNRIELLLKLRYQQAHDGELPKEGDLFRYFYNDIWAGLTGQDLQDVVLNEWQNIRDLFHVIEGWYEDPIKYNYIGFLIHSGYKLYDVVKAYYAIDMNADNCEFMKGLYLMIANKLPSEASITKDDSIPLDYRTGRSKIKTLLLFLNVYQMNNQLAALRIDNPHIMAPVYKFPFDLYVSQDWDVEHIDSATTNDLKEDEDKVEWIKQSLVALELENNEEAAHLLEAKQYDELLRFILDRSGNTVSDDDVKNSMGNLTLLDSATNRSYGNHIFAVKRMEIQKAIKGGRFVPLCTQLVFNKSFNNTNTDLRRWNDDDKIQYEQFIVNELKDFYKRIK